MITGVQNVRVLVALCVVTGSDPVRMLVGSVSIIAYLLVRCLVSITSLNIHSKRFDYVFACIACKAAKLFVNENISISLEGTPSSCLSDVHINLCTYQLL